MLDVYRERFFIRGHGLKRPREMGAKEVEDFLTIQAGSTRYQLDTCLHPLPNDQCLFSCMNSMAVGHQVLKTTLQHQIGDLPKRNGRHMPSKR